MMKKLVLGLALTLGLASPALADSGLSRNNPSQALGLSVAVGASAVGVSAAMPLMVAGAVVEEAAVGASRVLSGPLRVTERTIVTAGPSPAEAMKQNKTANGEGR